MNGRDLVGLGVLLVSNRFMHTTFTSNVAASKLDTSGVMFHTS